MSTMTKEQALYIAAILSEMKRNLTNGHVNEVVINSAIINTCGNLVGNAYDTIINTVLGKVTEEPSESRIDDCARCGKSREWHKTWAGAHCAYVAPVVKEVK